MLLITGTMRIAPEHVERARPAMERMVAYSRAEDGCLHYAYALDVCDPGLVRVSEAWRDQEAVDRHFRSDHLAAWRAARPVLGIGDRDLVLHHVTSTQPI